MSSFRSQLQDGRIQSTLIVVGWVSLCAVLFYSISLKLLNFSAFFNYIGSVTLLPSSLAVTLGFSVLLIELAAPLISLNPRLFHLSSQIVAWLFTSFALFHGVRVYVGDSAPCQCFGGLVSLEPTHYLLLDSIFAGTAFGIGSKVKKTREYAWSNRIVWLPVILVLGILEIKVVYSAASVRPKEFVNLEADVQWFSVGTAQLVDRGTMKSQVVIFGDYQCPFTRKMVESPEWRLLLADPRYSIQWRERPLTGIHPYSKWFSILSKRSLLAGTLATDQKELFELASRVTTKLDTSLLGQAELIEVSKLVEIDIELANRLKLSTSPLVYLLREGKVYNVASLSSLLNTQSKSAPIRRLE